MKTQIEIIASTIPSVSVPLGISGWGDGATVTRIDTDGRVFQITFSRDGLQFVIDIREDGELILTDCGGMRWKQYFGSELRLKPERPWKPAPKKKPAKKRD